MAALRGEKEKAIKSIEERLCDFANWHTSCNGGNVSEEAKMCMDAACEIKSLRSMLREADSRHLGTTPSL